jgi:hypothetical protein
MPRYKCVYFIVEEDLHEESIIFADFYIELNHTYKITKISRLDIAVLSDTIQINQLVKLNLKNSQETLDKLRLWVTFS